MSWLAGSDQSDEDWGNRAYLASQSRVTKPDWLSSFCDFVVEGWCPWCCPKGWDPKRMCHADIEIKTIRTRTASIRIKHFFEVLSVELLNPSFLPSFLEHFIVPSTNVFKHHYYRTAGPPAFFFQTFSIPEFQDVQYEPLNSGFQVSPYVQNSNRCLHDHCLNKGWLGHGHCHGWKFELLLLLLLLLLQLQLHNYTMLLL